MEIIFVLPTVLMKLHLLLLLVVLAPSNSLLAPARKSRKLLSISKSKSNDFQHLENEAVAIQKIVDAVDEGREADLINAGLKVTKLAENPRESLTLLISDLQVQEKILGSSLSNEEEEVLQAINNASREFVDSIPSVETPSIDFILSELDIDRELILEKKREAKLLLHKIIGDPDQVAHEPQIVQIDDNPCIKMRKNLNSQETVGDNFRKLLKNSMDSTSADEETVKGTVDFVTKSDFLKLDVRCIVGDALSSISEELDIDIQNEIVTDKNTTLRLEEIVATSMEELIQSMDHLEIQSSQLYSKLHALEIDLKRGTEEFEEEKKMELNELLAMQKKFQGDLDKSQVMAQNSAFDMTEVLREFEESRDMMTAIALFPFKSVDKKVCFVLGLSLFLKIPFDILYYISIREISADGVIVLLSQVILCILLFERYGISFFSAVLTKYEDST